MANPDAASPSQTEPPARAADENEAQVALVSPEPPSEEISRQDNEHPDPAPWQKLDVVMIEPVRWLIDEIIPEKSLVCLYGPPNCGKTFIALHMALSLIMGAKAFPEETPVSQTADTPQRPVRALPEHPVRSVVFMLSEAPESLDRRIAGWLEHSGYDRCEAGRILDQGFFAASGHNRIKLNNAEQREEFMKRLRALPRHPDLIVFDPLINVLDGDENDAQRMDSLIMGMDTLRREFGCSILLIHHPSKDGGAERGSSALRGGVDTHIAVRNVADLPPAPDSLPVHRVELVIEKQREAPRSPIRWLAMNPVSAPSNAMDRDNSPVIEMGRVPSPSHQPTPEEKRGSSSSHGPSRHGTSQRSRASNRELSERAAAGGPMISNRARREALECCRQVKKQKDRTFTRADVLRFHLLRKQENGKKPFYDSYFYKIMTRLITEPDAVIERSADDPNALLLKRKTDATPAESTAVPSADTTPPPTPVPS